MVATNDAEFRSLPGCTVAYQTFKGTLPSIEAAASAVRSWAVTMGYTPQGPMAIEIAGEPGTDLAQEYEIEVQLPVPDTAKADPSDRVQIKRFEPTDAAVMTLRGPHELSNFGEPVARMHGWLQSQNLQTSNVVRWVEITDPTKVSPEEQVTEVQYLVTRA